MTWLLNYRLWASIALSIALCGTHWKAYVAGKTTIQQAWDHAITLQALETVSAVAAARAKEQVLNANLNTLRTKYAQSQTDHLAADRLAAGRLRDLQAVADSSAGADSSGACGTLDDPRLCIIAQCGDVARRMDEAVKALASQNIALREFTQLVCVSR